MSGIETIFALVGAALTVAWAVALLVGVWKIREALVDEEFPAVDLVEAGRSFRVRVFRVRGRFGAIYQIGQDSQPVTVEPMFKDASSAIAHVRRDVSGS